MIIKKKIRVMVIEDSYTVRQLLEHTINADPRLEIVSSVESAELAFEQIENVRPDVISMDIHLPGMNGLDATQQIMCSWPTPIVIVSVSTRVRDAAFTMEALKAGALSVVEKPASDENEAFDLMSRRLCNQMVSMSQVRVVRQRPSLQAPPVHRPSDEGRMRDRPGSGPSKRVVSSLVGIVASTGGPKAISQIFNDLGADFALPVLFVQHMTPAFVDTFVNWLDRTTPLTVHLAIDGCIPQPGHAYHPPTDCHLRFSRGRLLLSDNREPVAGHLPCGDVLLDSIANELAGRGIGVVLTGMGNDGALGLRRMRENGAHTIVESDLTAVVNGMPAAARRMNAASEVLPLGNIGKRLRMLAEIAGAVTS